MQRRLTGGLLIIASLAVTLSHAEENLMIRVDLTAGALRSFIPRETLGAGLDGHPTGSTSRLLSGRNLAQMKAAGFGSYSYRLRTELAIEAWHWNPNGRFSGADGQSGYWLSDSTLGQLIQVSYGYRLPRRGSSVDQANNDGYSRLDDGDTNTFWKSNPYLDQHFTHDDNAQHPQWVMIDLGSVLPVDGARIHWATPYARVYRFEYCSANQTGGIEEQLCSQWTVFPQGQINAGKGGIETRRLAPKPVSTRFVRLLLLQAAAVPVHGSDIRDTLGYAIRELAIGRLDRQGTLKDVLIHAKHARQQTTIYVSSTDPWHTAQDRDPNTEQPGLDAFYRSGLLATTAPLIPVPILYDTPENAAAAIAYLQRRGYPLAQIEMGEEPDGQYVMPEDYAALYLQVATALHRIDPNLQLGGPGFQTAIEGYPAWPLGAETRPWMTRFFAYLKVHQRAADFNFFSFEWYPFDNCCGDTSLQLAIHPRIFNAVLEGLRADGLPAQLPWMITEYGYSAFACLPEVNIEGALLNAEIVGLALQQGAAKVFLYGLEPAELMDELECHSWGNNTLFLADAQWNIRSPTATLHGARLLNQNWIGNPDLPHQLFPLSISGGSVWGLERVSAFALRLPDNHWRLLVINKNPSDGYELAVELLTKTALLSPQTPITVHQFSGENYQWQPAKERGRAIPNQGATTWVETAFPITLPPYSLTVLAWKAAPTSE